MPQQERASDVPADAGLREVMLLEQKHILISPSYEWLFQKSAH
jgi:hypothetical protein